MMRRASTLAGALLLAAACGPAGPPGADEGAFVVRLGTDTTSVERYTLADGRLEALAVTRSPRTLLREAVLEFDDGGALMRYESRVLEPGSNEPIRQTIIRYDSLGAEIENVDREGRVETTRVDADFRTVPLSFDHFAVTEFAVRQALAREEDGFRLLWGGPMPIELRRPADDTVVLETGTLGTWIARVDGEGRFLELDAGGLGRQVERVPDLDVDALGRRYAEADERGEGMGPLSPRETAEFRVHGAGIRVEYGRPAKRGREVFGGLVPLGEVWRTGADQATHFVTDRPLSFAGERLPAGSYSVFTVPGRDAWTLILNEQTGQVGTEHDPDRDVMRVPMAVRELDPPEQRLTILAAEEGERGVFRIRWADTEASVPFLVEGRGVAGGGGR